MIAPDPLDHGILNVPISKRGRGSLDAQIDKALAAERRDARRQRRAMAQERKAVRAAEAARVKFTAEDLVDAVLIRDHIGWHRVVRVNAKSVTVKTGHSWDDRIPLDRILEVRT
ncbi:hypothetical protein [Nocardioides sp. T2.26MG-1]|uniref:hypothetical protein n=1 Tax=Nocardioides sp. T2.26MG-1 TaxID=3041166 RepID=UPI0024775261|nr:hypothetical protein [Nocardioides sp. T2.26MG-1]CAI9417179.1 hypothetical protein HIDPHFAB_02956 [Nocardioides sp. T2.26MG-1]